MTNPSLYRALAALPTATQGEIYDGQLFTKRRPTGNQVLAASSLCAELNLAYRKHPNSERWWVLKSPEIHFKLDEVVLVPDIAAWRKGRPHIIPDDHKFMTKPDWICEMTSPAAKDVCLWRKLALYAQLGITYLWLATPEQGEIETYQCTGDEWVKTGTFSGCEPVCAEPFAELDMPVAGLLGRDN